MEFYNGDIREHHRINEERQKEVYFKDYNDWLIHKYKHPEKYQKEIQEFNNEYKYTLSRLLVRLRTPFFLFSVIFSICAILFWLIIS